MWEDEVDAAVERETPATTDIVRMVDNGGEEDAGRKVDIAVEEGT